MLQLAWNHTQQLDVLQVIRLSKLSFTVCGPPDTYAETGFVHVKKIMVFIAPYHSVTRLLVVSTLKRINLA